IGAYDEGGAVGLNTRVEGQGATSLIGQFGAEAAMATEIGGYRIVPRLRLAFDHEFRNPVRTITTRLVSQPDTYVATDLAPTSDSWMRVGAGVDATLADRLSALLDFDASVARGRTEDYSVLARLKYDF